MECPDKSELVSYLFSKGKTLNEIKNLTRPAIRKKDDEYGKNGKDMVLCQICNKYVAFNGYKSHLLSKKHIELDQAYVAIAACKKEKLKKIEENPAESNE